MAEIQCAAETMSPTEAGFGLDLPKELRAASKQDIYVKLCFARYFHIPEELMAIYLGVDRNSNVDNNFQKAKERLSDNMISMRLKAFAAYSFLNKLAEHIITTHHCNISLSHIITTHHNTGL